MINLYLKKTLFLLLTLAFITIYPIFLPIGYSLPFLIGFFAFLVIKGVEEEKPLFILIGTLYLIDTETQLFLTPFLTLFALIIILFLKIKNSLFNSLFKTTLFYLLFFTFLVSYNFFMENLNLSYEILFLFLINLIIDLILVVLL